MAVSAGDQPGGLPSDAQFLDAFVAWANVVVPDTEPTSESLASGAVPWAMLSLL